MERCTCERGNRPGRRRGSANRKMQMNGLLRRALFVAGVLAAATADAAPARPAPPLGRPVGAVVRVSTEAELQAAVAALKSNTTILVTPGIYRLTKTLYVKGSLQNIALRGATNNADDVLVMGQGMTAAAVPYGIWTGGSVRGITIANMTIRDVANHAIILNGGTTSPRLYNLRLVNAGQQFVKANPDGAGGGVDNGVVEYVVIEYDARSRDSYTNGIDVHTGRNWVIRNSLFRNIRAPQGALAGPAILVWNGSMNTTVEGNTFLNCQREIAFGLIDRTPFDHSGGIVRNNFIYRDRSVAGDVAVGVFASPDTQVLHNTILVSGTFPHAIEYRFASAKGLTIRNNLLDADIHARDGATAMVAANYTSAIAALFVNAADGDLHLRPGAPITVAGAGVDEGPAPAPADDRRAQPTASSMPNLPRLQQADLVYRGAFRLPAGTIGGSSFEYGGSAMAYNAARDSLYIVGHDQQQLVAEISIPGAVNQTTLKSLATAKVLQPFSDPTEGNLNSATPKDPNAKKIGGLMVYGGKLYGTVYSYYDAAKTQVISHFVRPADLSRRGEFSGLYQVGTHGPGFVAGYMAPIPAAWQRALGGPAITGQCCLNIISRTSYGPAAFAFDPANLGQKRPVSVSPLVYYPIEHHTLGDWNVTSPMFNGSTQMGGVVFPEGARSVLFFGRQGIGPFCYGDASTGCVDPADPYKGTHAYRYVYQVWAYDAQDLAAVKAGLRQPWSVTPYATWQLTLPFADQHAQIRGAAYDPATGRLWISQAGGDGPQPLVYLFTVAAPAASALSTRP